MPLSTLCQRCGLCCDGNLFAYVSLRGSEVRAMQRLSLPVIDRTDGSPALAQRCAALEGRHCTVYAERPESCRRYRCHLLMALSEGEVSLEEALAVVDGAHARIRAVDAEIPSAEQDIPRAVLQRARHAEFSGNGGQLSARARAAWEQAEEYLDRHFRGRHRQG